MEPESWLIEAREGFFLLKGINSGHVCNLSDSLNGLYSIKKIASKIGGPIDTEKEFHGSLKADMGTQTVHLTIVNNSKDIFTVAIEKMYKIYKLDPAYCLIQEEKQRIDATEK